MSEVQETFVAWLAEWPRREVAAAVPVPRHPMLVSDRVAQRALTPGELAFVASLRGVEPAKVSPDDATLLADLEAAAASSAERRLVGQVAGPVRRHHDRAVESAGLQAVVAAHAAAPEMHAAKYLPYAVSVVEDQLTVEARGALERGLAAASPEARDALVDAVQTAPSRAQMAVREAWAAVELRRLEAHTAATVRLLQLSTGADPVSSQPAPRNSSAFDRGAARARAMHGDRVPSGRELEEAFGPRSVASA